MVLRNGHALATSRQLSPSRSSQLPSLASLNPPSKYIKPLSLLPYLFSLALTRTSLASSPFNSSLFMLCSLV
jgi:hypothetical protein